MSDEQTLLDLAARCEAASGPDRELDAAISTAVDGDDWSGSFLRYLTTEELPAYSASLDAAMTLVPEGWYLELEQHTTTWTATLADAMWFVDRRVVQDANSGTPALALTAAALRARASHLHNRENGHG